MRVGRIVLLVLLLALLASCSIVRVAYDNADWVLARMAGSYVDMDRAQARELKAELGQFHAWHRHEELPHYAVLLDDVSDRLERGLAREDVVWAIGAARARYEVLSRQAADGLAPWLLSLNARQVDGLAARFEAANRKFYARSLPDDPEKAVQVRADWLRARVEDWTGRTTPAQRERLVALVRAFPDAPALVLADRRRRQAQLIEMLRTHAAADEAQAQIFTLLTDPDAGRSEHHVAALAAWEASFINAVLELDRSLTPRQRETAVARMRGYADEFRSMAQEQARGTKDRHEARGTRHEEQARGARREIREAKVAVNLPVAVREEGQRWDFVASLGFSRASCLEPRACQFAGGVYRCTS
jgi:hypothetical protein